MKAHQFSVGDSTFIVDHDPDDQLKVYARKVTRVSAKQVHVEAGQAARARSRSAAIGRVARRPVLESTSIVPMTQRTNSGTSRPAALARRRSSGTCDSSTSPRRFTLDSDRV
jgi:hypothetical protein